VLAPAGIVMLVIVRLAIAGALLTSVTLTPPPGAGHSRMIVPVTGFEPTTGFGLSVNDSITGGRTLTGMLTLMAYR
jgi:hypothetical protein